MTNPTPKKISRRDAFKILGAVAGATVLANLPSTWSKPELMGGVLPAHAQTSDCWALIVEFLIVPNGVTFGFGSNPLPTQVIGNAGEQGGILYWACQPGCIQWTLAAFGVEPFSATVRLTPLGNPPIDWVFDANGENFSILVDGASGVYTENFAPHPTCTWAD